MSGDSSPLPLFRTRTRVRDFASGVYKRFPLAGNATYTIKIDRNQSHNTILSGLFIDRIDPIVGRTSTAAASPIVGPMSTAAMRPLPSSRPRTSGPLSHLLAVYDGLSAAGYTRDASTIADRIAESAKSLPLPEHESLVLDFWRSHQIPHPQGFRRFRHEPCLDGITLAEGLAARLSTAADSPIVGPTSTAANSAIPSSRPWTGLRQNAAPRQASEPLSGPLSRLRALAVRCSQRRELTPLAALFWRHVAKSAKTAELTPVQLMAKGQWHLRMHQPRPALNLFRLAARNKGDHQPEAKQLLAFTQDTLPPPTTRGPK